MRYLAFLCSLCLVLSSCGGRVELSELEYQDKALYIEADFTLDGESLPLTVELDAPTYDTEGRMLQRGGKISVKEGSLLSGICFEYINGGYYICFGDLQIPLSDEDILSGITDIVSLFCISEESYYSSEKIDGENGKSLRSLYKNGDNEVEVITDLTSGMPTKISAKVDGRTLTAEISLITAK